MSETEEPRRHPRWKTLALVAALIALLIVAIFLPPLISLGHYRRSITANMSAALGRPVYVGSMQLRLLPTPGISMTDFTVEEDPAFGYEPALHANSVVASLRLSSLWRGRLEVSRISLDEASVNLVRNSAGQWSIGSVLLRASQIPNAPTAQRHSGPHPRFPYIEASDARIDFKEGTEKKPFSLMNAEFSMWQASGDEWRVRLQAQPVRTDLELHLSDTGQLSLEGSLRRASDVNAMPVALQAAWTGAQLGQVTRLLAGLDSGWRGDLTATATIRGSMNDLQLRSRLRFANLRRQEFQPASTIDVDATCQSDYRRIPQRLDDITCFWPVGSGHFLLTGSTEGLASPTADVQIEINRIPASFAWSALALMRPHAQNVTTAGTINGSFHLVTGQKPLLSGDATVTAALLSWSGSTLALPPLHFIAFPQPSSPRGRRTAEVQPQNGIQLQTLAIPFGEPQPLALDARFTRTGFEMHVAGPASVNRLISSGGSFGFLGSALNAVAPKGRADLNVTTKGNWILPLSGGTGIATTGSVHLQGAELHPAFLPAPVEVASADLTLSPDQVTWQNASFRFQRMGMRGSLQFPFSCNQPGTCPAAFTLQTDSLDAGVLQAALTGQKPGFLGNFLEDALGRTKSSDWPPLRGSIQCGKLNLGALALGNATASVAVEGKKLSLESIDAQTFAGSLHASGQMDIEGGVPQWHLDLRLIGAKAASAGEMFQEQWGSGVVNGEATLSLHGYSGSDLASSASGNFRFTWQKGGLGSVASADSMPLERFDRWSAAGTIADGALTFTSGGLSHSGRLTPVRGTISLNRQINLTVQTRRGPQNIEGTLARPVLATVAAH